jgi:hypothetical protein
MTNLIHLPRLSGRRPTRQANSYTLYYRTESGTIAVKTGASWPPLHQFMQQVAHDGRIATLYRGDEAIGMTYIDARGNVRIHMQKQGW